MLILCLYLAGIYEEDGQNLCWAFCEGIGLVSVPLRLNFESLLAFVVRGPAGYVTQLFPMRMPGFRQGR